MGTIDYWCNAFTPDRRELWDAVIERQGLALKVRTEEEDSFTDPGTLVARMDALSIDTLLLPAADLPQTAGPFDGAGRFLRPGVAPYGMILSGTLISPPSGGSTP